MYKTFNMGMGFSIIINKNDVDESIKTLQKYSNVDVKIVGRIEKGRGVSSPNLGLKF